MDMSPYIIQQLSACVDIPEQELTPELARKIILDKPVNILALVRPETYGNKMFPSGKDRRSPSSKLAMVINLICVDQFDSVEEFIVHFAHDPAYLRDIWANDLRKPSFDTIRELIEMYEVDPLRVLPSRIPAISKSDIKKAQNIAQ